MHLFTQQVVFLKQWLLQCHAKGFVALHPMRLVADILCLEGKDGQNCHCTHLAYVGTPLLTVDINSVQDCLRDRSCILIFANGNITLCAPVICFNLCLGKVMRVPTSAATFLVAFSLMLVGLG